MGHPILQLIQLQSGCTQSLQDNDPLSQTNRPASSYHSFHLKIDFFVRQTDGRHV